MLRAQDKPQDVQRGGAWSPGNAGQRAAEVLGSTRSADRDVSRGWKNGLTRKGCVDNEKKVFDLRADEVTSPGDFEVSALSCG